MTKRTGVIVATVLGGILLFPALGGSARADDRAFLHCLGGSVCVDDKNLLGLTGEAGYVYDMHFLDFPGGAACPGAETFLGFDGCLEDKNIGRAIPNAFVTLLGAGLPLRTKSDHSGNLRASSSSSAEEIRVVIQVAGYQPYSIIVLRSEKKTGSYQNMRPTFSLTPVLPLLHARMQK